MAFRAKSGLARLAACGVASAALCLAAATASLERVNERRARDFAPVLEGEAVTVEGVISAKRMVYPLFAHIPIQDQSGHGLLLECAPAQFTSLEPGERVEARGTVSKRAGLPVLLVSQVTVLTHETAPAARKISLPDAQSPKILGLLVTVEGRVVDKGENVLGDYVLIGDVRKPLKILLPRGAAKPASLDRYEIGDHVRAEGIASQYCPFPPYNRSFQVVLSDEEDIVLVNKRWLISPEWFAVSVAFLVFALVLWWMRERRMSAQRNMVRTFYMLSEEVIGVASPAEILTRLAATLPGILKLAGLHVYLYNRTTKELDRVRQAESAPFSVPVHAPEGALPLGPALCFRNQALLTISDTRRSPFFPDGRPERQPGSVMFVPMFAESEIVGVLEMYANKADHEFNRDERILTQHLANQIGIALRLLEEKSIREQLYRSEKLAAVGQLISGIASELKSPLDSISALAENIALAPAGTLRSDLYAISGEAHKASDIVARLVSFMQPERTEPKRIELNALVRSLIEFRRQEWRNRGFEIHEVLSPNPIYILGSQGQLERVFLDLLVQAEHALSESSDKRLAIATSILGRRAVVEIDYAVNAAKAPWEGLTANSGFTQHADGVTRGIVHSHGGELRMSRSPEGIYRLELEFPMAPARMAETDGIARAFTCLVVEPDAEHREELVRVLTQRGCRVIPAAAGEDGAELVQRLRFDIVFCSVRLPGLNWVEFSESIRTQVGGFVLLTEGFDFEMSRGLLNAESHVLSKPFSEAELDNVLAAIESRLSSPESRLLLIRSPERKAAGNPY